MPRNSRRFLFHLAYLVYYSLQATGANAIEAQACSEQFHPYAAGALAINQSFPNSDRRLAAPVAMKSDLPFGSEFSPFNLHGMSLVNCIQDMVAAGEAVNLTTIRDGLSARGIHYPSGGKHPSIMRLWLSKAGVFVGKRWLVDPYRIEKILGLSTDDFSALADLSNEQRAFLRALANTGSIEPQSANEIARLASATYGVKFPEKSLPKLILNELEDNGYIRTKKTTSGRGAKPFQVAPTDKLVADIVEPLLEQLHGLTDPKLLDLLRTPLFSILAELDNPDRYKAGLALEALAFKIMRIIDMTYVATRLRAKQTGGAEVDLIFESARLVFSRWQVQCKNTGSVSLDDVAKEVGLSIF